MAAVVCGMVLGAAAARADAMCEKGWRDTTAAERGTIIGVLEAVRAALPAAPEGWVIGGYEEIAARQSICRDIEAAPWGYTLTRILNRADDLAEREQFEADAGAVLRAQAEARQPQMDALMARMQSIGAELGEAAQRGDQARIDELNAQLVAIQSEFDALMNEGPGEAQMTAIGAAMMQDRTMEVAVAVNAVVVAPENLSLSAAPPGAGIAYRGDIVHEGVTNTQVLVLLGDWQAQEDGVLRAQPHDAVQPEAAHAMVVTVTADPSRIDSLLAAVDFRALSGILQEI